MRFFMAIMVTLLSTLVLAQSELRQAIQQDYKDYLEPLYWHFHENPELSFLEKETAARMAQELRTLDIEVTEGVGKTGVVGIMKNGPGPMVLVRADMDGLPVAEDSGLDRMSKARQVDIDGVEKPVMHACGHDVHITALLGTARRLHASRDQWSGTVMFIVQPAEERIDGARAMLDDGLYDRFGIPKYALAFHVSAGSPAGKVMVAGGLRYSSSDSVNITVRGVGAHGASPHSGKDPIYISAQIIVALQSLVSRELSPLEPGVVTVGSIHGGFKHNIIPDAVKLELTVRSNAEATREKLLSGIKRVAEGVGRAHGLPDDLLPIVEWGFESTPTTINDQELADRMHATFTEKLGEDMLFYKERTGMGAEDFAYFVQPEHGVKGLYFNVGGTSEEDLALEAEGKLVIPSHHSPFFKVEAEPAIISGAEAMTVAVLELLQPSPSTKTKAAE